MVDTVVKNSYIIVKNTSESSHKLVSLATGLFRYLSLKDRTAKNIVKVL